MAWGRVFQITINCTTGESITITDAECDFSCVRDKDPQPNEAELTIWGITADTQNTIAVSGSTLSIAAGYQDEGLLTLFQGELISAVTVKPAEVYGLRIKMYESLIPFRASVTRRAFKKGQALGDAVKQVASDMGLACQVSKGAAALTLAKAVSGVALSRDVLNSLCKPVNAGWSIQYQTLQVSAGDSLATGSAVFSPESGLIGTPALKLHTPKRHKSGTSQHHHKNKAKKVATYPWPPKNSHTDYTSGARRQIGTIEGINWRSVLRGGVEIGDKVQLESPSLGQGWWVTITKITHRFGTRDMSVWESQFEGVIE
ncbi:hypothetical protein GUY16_02830 [Enterobacter mori]|nr:hypothetical protein [Enterobacter mori]MBS3045995.1 hypothetical protein [Enterobacter mori]